MTGVPPDAAYRRPQDLNRLATPGRRAQWALEAFLWDRLYWGPVRAMTPERASDFGGGLLRALGPLTGAHRTMLRNLRLAFPGWTETEIRHCALASWEHLGRTAGELPHLSSARPFAEDGSVDIIGLERLDRAVAGGRPAVIISGHFANWELVASTICKRPIACQITYRAANNPHIDRRIAAARLAYGVEALAAKGIGTRDLMRALARGDSVALMNDQKFNQGLPATFFGHEAMTAPGPTRLAMRYGATLLPATARRLGAMRHQVVFHEPIALPRSDSDGDIRETLEAINRFYEAEIRRAPEQWFWMHARWPKEAWIRAGALSPRT
jgi:KDO2-lipid IV(A) lauroyltransferase